MRSSTLLTPEDEARLDRETVETLRGRIAERKKTAQAMPTVKQVQGIVDCLLKARSLPETARRVGVNDEFVLNVVSDFGTWLVHSLRPKFTPLALQPPLFECDGEPTGPHAGFEPWMPHRRDIVNALSAIVKTAPDNEVVARFVSRTYSTRAAQLTYPLIAGVWGQVVRDRLPGLALVSDDLVFLGVALDAYDLLDVARSDAVASIQRLLEVDPEDTDAVIAAANGGAWLCEGIAKSIARAAETAKTEPAAKARLERDLAHLRVLVQERPLEFAPPGVRHLTLGQVQRICALSGIKVEAENRREELEIRTTLKEIGLASDLDRLVHDALRLAEAGLIDEFWDVMNVRVEGDPMWVEQLERLLAKA